MKKTMIKKFEKLLLEEKQTIIARNEQKNKDLAIDTDGDDTDEIQAKIIALAANTIAARDQEKLRKIDAALARIKADNFGNCEECGEEIGERRLMLNPCFITCIGCAEHLEAMKKHIR